MLPLMRGRTAVSFLALIAFPASACIAGHPRSDIELFVDEARIAYRANVVRRIHPATKLAAPVLEPDRPWEGVGTYLYGSVWRDAEGGFRMWYTAGGHMLLATSADGVRWEKPELDVHEHEGRKTNVVIPRGGQGGGVVVDEAEPDPARRYKALLGGHVRDGGFRGYYSADGVHWHSYGDKPVIRVGSEIAHVIRDPATGKYLGFIRPFATKLRPKHEGEKRLGAVVTSDDFQTWSDMKVVLRPDAIDDAWAKAPDQRTEFYAMNGFPYGRSWLGVVPVFQVTQIHEKWSEGQSRFDGPMHGQLIVSRDGLAWSRMPERDWALPGGSGYDRSIMNVATAPLVVGDEIWHYFTAISTTHGAPRPPKRITVGLAKWRLDGYASLDAGAVEGVVETVPLTSRGRLEVNADARGGQLVVELLDEAGRPIPGYARAASTVLNSDSVRHSVAWGGRAGLPEDRAYRVRLILKNASLYSYRIVPAESRP